MAKARVWLEFDIEIKEGDVEDVDNVVTALLDVGAFQDPINDDDVHDCVLEVTNAECKSIECLHEDTFVNDQNREECGDCHEELER